MRNQKTSDYWNQERNKYQYMIRSLERELEEQNAGTSMWDAIYQRLLSTQEKLKFAINSYLHALKEEEKNNTVD